MATQLIRASGWSPGRWKSTIRGGQIATPCPVTWVLPFRLELCMLAHGLARLRRLARRCADTVRARVSRWTKPRPRSLAMGLATDLVRPRRELLLENAFLRQQVLVLSRTTKRPAFTPWDRGLLVLIAGRLRTWAGALLIIQPETLLRWHRQGFRLL